MMHENYPIVVFSHLRWDFVYQRPQHLLSRLAREHRVIFIEEPVLDLENAPHWERTTPRDNVLVCRPHTPLEIGGYDPAQIDILQPMVRDLIREEKVTGYVAWLYTPMALPLARELGPVAVVYDCMDELSAFLGASPKLLHYEQELLDWADVVFTGGPSLYRGKKDRHHNVHCFPSSVDKDHFSKARIIAEPADQASIPHPRFGYYGVIDERMDLGLLNEMARSRPEWQIVMVGPVVKIEEANLPVHPNIHYLGQRTYEELPAYLGGWDVCIMPFARNEATRFISPTKTLEYMAAELPIVSTPLTDVAEPYGHIVYLGDTPREFIASCEQALTSSESERGERTRRMREVLSRTSWDSTARAMAALIDEAVAGNRSDAGSTTVNVSPDYSSPRQEQTYDYV